MQCNFCKKPATKVNTTETRTGSGTVKTKTYVCNTHAGLSMGDTCDVNIIRLNEKGQNRFEVTGGAWKRQSR